MIDLIGDYEKHLRHQRRKTSTIGLYIDLLRRMDRELPHGLLAAYREEIHDWIFGPSRAESTRQLYVTIVKGFTSFAVSADNEYRLDVDEAAGLPRVRASAPPPKPIPLEHIADIRRRIAAPWDLLVDLAYFGGMRCIEIAGLNRAHVDQEETLLLGKGGKYRPIPTHPVIWERVRHLPEGPLAVDEDGVVLDRRQVSRGGWRHMHALGHRYSMHQLRHAYATQTYESSGHDIALVQELLGHASVATTRRYIEVSKDRKAAAVLGLPVPGS